MMCKCGSGMSKAMCDCGANKGARSSMKKGINWSRLAASGLANASNVARGARKIKNQTLRSVVNNRRNQMSGMIGDGHQIADDVHGNLQDIAYYANKLAYSGAIKNPKVNRALQRMDGLINYTNMDNAAIRRNRQVPAFEAFPYELGNRKKALQNGIMLAGAAALGSSLLNRNRQEQKAPMSGPMKKGINWARLASRGYGAAADAVRDNASRANRAVGYYSLKPGPRPPSRRSTRTIDGGPMFPAAYLTDAQANKLSSLAGRAYNYGENTLARRSDMLLDPRIATRYNNMKDQDQRAAIRGLSTIAGLIGAYGAYDSMKKKPTSAAGSRGVTKGMSKSSKNKYGV